MQQEELPDTGEESQSSKRKEEICGDAKKKTLFQKLSSWPLFGNKRAISYQNSKWYTRNKKVGRHGEAAGNGESWHGFRVSDIDRHVLFKWQMCKIFLRHHGSFLRNRAWPAVLGKD